MGEAPGRAARRYVFIALAFFAAALALQALVLEWDWYGAQKAKLPDGLRWLDHPLRNLLVVLAGLYAAHTMGPIRAIRELGLASPPFRAVLFALVSTSPMLIGPLVLGEFKPSAGPLELVFLAGVWPLSEEILFRGYAFRQLHRRGGMGLWTAALVTGAVFGLVHLTNASIQRQPLVDQLGTIAIITVGGVLSAWVFVKWDDNLWAPFAIHGLMNLWWELFSMGDTALGSWQANGFRLLAVVIAIVITVFRDSIPVFSGRNRVKSVQAATG